MTTLHLIPVGLGVVAPERWLPPQARACAASLRVVIAENARTARAVLKQIGTDVPIQQIEIFELRADTPDATITQWLTQWPPDTDVGLVSEAGCPAVADPGARVVALAHRHAIRVVPWTGPSSIMLGLMASGLEGQRFTFHGYAPVKAAARDALLHRWEADSQRLQQTQILIETPYRNGALLAALVHTLHPDTRLCVASALTCDDEWIATRTIAQWRTAPEPPFAKRPTLFLFLAAGTASRAAPRRAPARRTPARRPKAA